MSAPRRLHCASLPDDGGEVVLESSAARHAKVLRLAPGDAVLLFDGQGGEAEGTLLAFDADLARCAVGPRQERVSSGPRVVLCPGFPKGGKLDVVVRGTTELGVAEIHPFLADRSVARPDARRAASRRDRLLAVAREAARQSGRADVPLVHLPASLGDVLARVPSGAARLAFIPGGSVSLAEAIERSAEPGSAPVSAQEAWLVIGPEGGLTAGEMATLEAAGFSLVGLGETVLRAETAGLVVVALASYAMGSFRPSNMAR